MTALPKPLSRLVISDLDALSRDQLSWLWERAYGCPPPKGVRRDLLEHAAAWHLQAKRNKNQVKRVQSRMSALVKRQRIHGKSKSNTGVLTASPHETCGAESVATKPKSRTPQTGARLVREWNGRSYVVDVVEGGYILDGRRFTSLSALAFHITGTRWSGPRFFGL